MDSRVKTKWLAALRSGDYKQGYSGQLRTLDDKYCALGVLCDVAVQEGIIRAPIIIDGDLFSGYSYDGSATNISSMIKIWAGYVSTSKLVNMNDEKHNKFTTIANWIEANL